jgi:CheY-like chemotaxis protein
MMNQTQTRARVLLVEDESLIAMLLEDMLADLGCDVAAIASELAEAVALARTETIDLAIIDINLGGVAAYPVAQALRERGIPFAFVTGYGAADSDPAHRDVPVLQKPFRGEHLESIVQRLRAQGCTADS